MRKKDAGATPSAIMPVAQTALAKAAPAPYSFRCPRRPGAFPMKLHIDIDCTPEEARAFLGLPDVQPVQAAVMKELEQRLMSAMQAMDPETLMKTWVPAGISNLEQMQRMFWQQFAGGSDKKAGQ
jgi:hypothetical protein